MFSRAIKPTFLLVSLMVFLPACFGKNKPEKQQLVTIVDDSGLVAPEVLQLLQLTGTQHDGTLSDIVAKTQESWLRTPGTEIWHIQHSELDSDLLIKKAFKDLCFYDAIQPILVSYDYVFIMGGIFNTMVQRIAYLIDLYNQGLRFNHVVLLAGARPAEADLGETVAAVEKLTGQKIAQEQLTEADLIQYAYNYAKMPEAMRSIPVQIINVAMVPTANGTLRRPNTADTIKLWLQSNPAAGTVLAISNQPYAHYQHSVVKTLLPKEFALETIGYSCGEDKKIGVLLDSLARILYQEKQRLAQN